MIVARIDRGEEIVEKVKEIAIKEGIKLANINALGATNEFTIGVFDTSNKQYISNDFKGDYEIVSLTGSINTMNGEYYSHLHMSCGDSSGKVVGGHLNKAIVSVTCEMFIYVLNGEVDRELDESIGINIFKF